MHQQSLSGREEARSERSLAARAVHIKLLLLLNFHKASTACVDVEIVVSYLCAAELGSALNFFDVGEQKNLVMQEDTCLPPRALLKQCFTVFSLILARNSFLRTSRAVQCRCPVVAGGGRSGSERNAMLSVGLSQQGIVAMVAPRQGDATAPASIETFSPTSMTH